MNSRAKNLFTCILAICMMASMFTACNKKAKKKDQVSKTQASTEVATTESSDPSDDADKPKASALILPTDATPTPEETATPTPEPTATPEPTSTPTPEPTATPEPTSTPTPEPQPEDTPTPEPEDTPTPEPEDTPTPEPEPETPENTVHYAIIEYDVDITAAWFEVLTEDQKETWPHGKAHLYYQNYIVHYEVQLKDGAEYHSTNVDDYITDGVLESHLDELNEKTIAWAFEQHGDKVERAEIDTYHIMSDPKIVEFCD
ncbi:MAG: hypothetical protein J5750_01380 [Clostridiales bacterium]|nr:hypothetical protein [Clostridiales bacterium]